MKQLSKSLAALLVASCCSISCKQEVLDQPATQLELLIQQVLSSDDFRNLGIPMNALDIENAGYVNDAKNSIFINPKDVYVNGAVVALLDENDQVLTAVYVEMHTETKVENVYAEMKAGSFNGSFLIRSGDGGFEANIEKSKIAGSKSIATLMGRTKKCKGWTEIGGPLDCFGSRLVDMNWVDRTFCYTSFMVCMAEEVASCIVDDCRVR
jgi:hypothetical protein